MNLYLFRFLDSDGKPYERFGIAYAKNASDLYWQIDEHGDPNACLIRKVNCPLSISFNTFEEDGWIHAPESDECGFSGEIFDLLNSGKTAKYLDFVRTKDDKLAFAEIEL